MDRTDPQVAAVVAAVSPLDDAALAALASRGLLRRAQKDLDKAPPQIVAAEPGGLVLEVEAQRVLLAHPVMRSTCTCNTGLCRHILVAILFLRAGAEAGSAGDAAPPGAASTELPRGGSAPGAAEDGAASVPLAPVTDLLAVGAEELGKWAGKVAMRRAGIALSQGYEVSEQRGSGSGPSHQIVVVHLAAQNVHVRLLSGELEGLLCGCHAAGACAHKVAAVLAYQAWKSGQAVAVPQTSLEASSGAPRDRDEVRQAVRTLLCEMMALGLCRMSGVTEQRLRTLATSAHGVDLPRLERLLQGLSESVARMLARDAQVSADALLREAAHVDALCAALAQPAPALVGEHRSEYVPVVGSLSMVGLGAARWRTPSGYHGLSLYFWLDEAKQWTSWIDARPVDAPGFDPRHRFNGDDAWPGGGSPRAVVSGRWSLSGIYRNITGRFTARAGTRGVRQGDASPEHGPLIRDFAELTDAALGAFAPGLAGPSHFADLVLLAPERWRDATYDPVAQAVTRVVEDGAGRGIPLVLRHSEETDSGLTILQQVQEHELRAVLGFLRLDDRGLHVEPITLWTAEKPIHLTLDAMKASVAQEAAPVAATQAAASTASVAAPGRSALVERLAQVEDELVAIAESGTEIVRELSSLKAAARDCRSVGLVAPAAAIEDLVGALDRFRKSTDRDAAEGGRRLLRCAYVVRLALDCAAICRAVPA